MALDYLAIPYMFVSSLVRQVVDASGVVHDTFPYNKNRFVHPYNRATYCSSTLWHLLEPINACEPTVTTCLTCLTYLGEPRE